mgnify:CR=1 FL=1|tara:strand:+ start:356 stop:841 length:486 start_codon:yes stop_codon:yes gene_type:complete
MSADNQQERLDAKWIVGFVDGEGCFHVSINRNEKMKLDWQVLPEFRVVQHEKNQKVLYKLKEYFGFGHVVINHGDRKEFRVRKLDDLRKIVIFFNENKLRTTKSKDLNCFSKILDLMLKNEHLSLEGLLKIEKIISNMNRQIKRASRILRDYTPNTSSTKV